VDGRFEKRVPIRLRSLTHPSDEDLLLGAPVFAIFAQGRLSAPLSSASLRMTNLRERGFAADFVSQIIFGVRVPNAEALG
jgi:hypothetical protein